MVPIGHVSPRRVKRRSWWLRIGDARITVSPKQDGVAEVHVERGAYGDIEPRHD